MKDPSKVLGAGRITLDFWDKEKGYYFNGTYYGDKDLLAVGGAFQTQQNKTAWSLDGIVEKNLHEIGVFGLETEYQRDGGLVTNEFDNAPSHGFYVLGDYLFPVVIGWGKFQLLDKYSVKDYDATPTTADAEIKTNEAAINYIIKEFSARVGLYYLTKTSSNIPAFGSPSQFGLKLQLQM